MISDQEFELILADETKRIEGDIRWHKEKFHRPAFTFRVPLHHEGEQLLEVVGRWSPKSGKLSYLLLCRGTGRIYGLDMGADHRNPGGQYVGESHKHRWTAEFSDKHAYVPPDITAAWNQPIEVWLQFCGEARIEHQGTLHPPEWHEELPL